MNELTPELIAQKRFTSAFRGFEPDEVRLYLEAVSGHVAHLEARVRVLEVDLIECRAAATDAAAGAQVMADVALGPDATQSTAEAALLAKADTERIMREARDEASMLVARANEEAGRIILRARAESRGKGGGPEAAQFAGVDLPEDPEAARQAARAMVAEARAVRERILTDLAKRRRTAHVQLEQLRVARERLLESMRETRRVIDGATRDLTHVETEARLAAEAAGRKLAAEPMPTADEMAIELLGVNHLSLLPSRAADTDEADAEVESSSVPEVMPDVVLNEMTSPPDIEMTHTPDDATVELRRSDVLAAAVVDVVSEEAVIVEDVMVDVDVVENVIVEDVIVEDVIAEEGAVEVVSEEAIEPVPTPTVDDDGGRGGRPRRERATVDDLFARLRADRETASAQAKQVLERSGSVAVLERPEAMSDESAVLDAVAIESGTADVIADPVEEEAAITVIDLVEETEVTVPDDVSSLVAQHIEGVDSSAVESSAVDSVVDSESLDEEATLAARDALLAPIVDTTVRQLRRIVQDEQSSALVTLRSSRVRPGLDALLGDLSSHTARFAGPINDGVDRVVSAAGADTKSVRAQMDATVLDLLDEVVTMRRAGLAAVLELDGVSTDSVGESLRAGAREWSTERITNRVTDVMSAAYAVSVFSMTTTGARVRWVLDDGTTSCSECDDNVLAEAASSGDSFPTGHLHPPAHRGCRCVVVPLP
jgi:DivIVA domain-containing protein